MSNIKPRGEFVFPEIFESAGGEALSAQERVLLALGGVVVAHGLTREAATALEELVLKTLIFGHEHITPSLNTRYVHLRCNLDGSAMSHPLDDTLNYDQPKNSGGNNE